MTRKGKLVLTSLVRVGATRVAATAALALVLLSIGALISCNKSESPQNRRNQAGQTSNAEQALEAQPRSQRLLR